MSNETTAETFLPIDVVSKWERMLEHTNLLESQHTLLMNAVHYALPPLNKTHLARALHAYLNDHHHHNAIHAPNDIVKDLTLPSEPLKKYIVKYPLCHALTEPASSKSIADLDSPFQTTARRMLSRYFSEVKTNAEAGLWYDDVQQTRDVVCELVKLDIDQSVSPPIDRSIVSLINQHLVASTYTSERMRQNCQRVMQLFAGINKTGAHDAKLPGTRKRSKSSRNIGKTRSKASHIDNELADKIRESIQVKQRQTLPAETRDDDLDLADEAQLTMPRSTYLKPLSNKAVVHDLGLPIETYAVRERTTSAETADEQSLSVIRQTPSTLTAQDDATLVSKTNRQAATDSLTSLSDIQRLAPGQIVSLLSDVREDSITWAFCMLLLSTGLPYKRLMTLSRVQHWPEELPAGGEKLKWNPEQHCLWYALLDGPSGDADAPNKQVVLNVPHDLNNALIIAANQYDQHQPLRHAPKALKNHTRRQKHHLTGLSSTPARLTASSIVLVRGFAQDETSQFALSGRFGVKHGARAAYRALDQGELDTLFNAVIEALRGNPTYPIFYPLTTPDIAAVGGADYPYNQAGTRCARCETVTLKAPIASPTIKMAFSSSPAQWHTGSALAVPPDLFAPWSKALGRAKTEAISRFTSVLSPKKRSIKEACNITRWEAFNTYLMLLLSTGCRPHGLHTRYQLSNKQLWVAVGSRMIERPLDK